MHLSMENLDMNKLIRRPLRESSEGDQEVYYPNNKYCSKNMQNPEANEDPTATVEDSDVDSEEDGSSETLEHKKSNLYPNDQLRELQKNCVSHRKKGVSKETEFNVHARKSLHIKVSSSKNKSSSNDDVKPDSYFGFSYFIWKIIIVVLVVCFSSLWFFWSSRNPATQTPFAKMVIENLKKEFNKQSELTFLQVKFAIQGITVDGSEPKKPEILLFLSSSEAENSAVCFSKCLVSLLKTKINNFIEKEGKQYGGRNAAVAKEKLDSEIQENFHNESFNVLLMKNLDLVPDDAAMIFHGYCDEENAPFKRTLFIMTVTSKEELPVTNDSKTIDKYAKQLLRKSWVNLGEDQLESLLTRITVRVALIRLETACSSC